MRSIINKINIKILFIFLVYIFFCIPTYAQDKTYLTPDVNIISVTPVQGSGISIDRGSRKKFRQLVEILWEKEKFFNN